MEDLNSTGKGQHKMAISARKTCSLTGIIDAVSFDLNEVLLETDLGMLMIKGSELKVKRLTLEKGEVDLEGRIDSLTYSDHSSLSAKGESLLGRLFK
ncbi:MAG: sporulation protein YabP [Lachnospiraceae bacterium]|nr:sporulation protein YabP [Lachnospiraceae bacterium]